MRHGTEHRKSTTLMLPQELALAEDARAVGALQRLEALDAEIAGAEWEGAAQLARGLAHCGAQLGRLAEEAARLQVDGALVGGLMLVCCVRCGAVAKEGARLRNQAGRVVAHSARGWPSAIPYSPLLILTHPCSFLRTGPPHP